MRNFLSANIARQIALMADCPITVSGLTVNRFCSSGLQTIALASQRVIEKRLTVRETVSLVARLLAERTEPARTAPDSDTVDIPGTLVTEGDELDQETIERAILAAWTK